MAEVVHQGQIRYATTSSGSSFYRDILTHNSDAMLLMRTALEANPVLIIPNSIDLYTAVSNGHGR